MPVLDLGKHRRVWLLSIPGRDAVVSPEERVCHGFGLPYPKPFSAAFAYDNRLWLQVGKERWSVSDIRSVRQTKETARSASYQLEFQSGATIDVMVRFPSAVVAMRILDPTHDEIDSWSEDIIKLLPYTAADGWQADPDQNVTSWASRVLSHWTAGIRSHGPKGQETTT